MIRYEVKLHNGFDHNTLPYLRVLCVCKKSIRILIGHDLVTKGAKNLITVSIIPIDIEGLQLTKIANNT